MSGQQDLDVLISSMQPVMQDEVYVFATVAKDFDYPSLDAVMSFQEAEGTTIILPKLSAEKADISHEFPCKMITLNVHSSLEAVGFLARITNHLAKLNMGVNPVSAFYHDHLFVPADRAEEALQSLKELSLKQ